MCGCKAHEDQNAVCTCDCPSHGLRVKAESTEVTPPYRGPRFTLEVRITDRHREPEPVPEPPSDDKAISAWITAMNMRRTPPEYSLLAEVEDGTSLRQLLEAAAKNVEEF